MTVIQPEAEAGETSLTVDREEEEREITTTSMEIEAEGLTTEEEATETLTMASVEAEEELKIREEVTFKAEEGLVAVTVIIMRRTTLSMTPRVMMTWTWKKTTKIIRNKVLQIGEVLKATISRMMMPPLPHPALSGPETGDVKSAEKSTLQEERNAGSAAVIRILSLLK